MGVTIKEVSVYHPQMARHNDYYISHFQKQGKDITRLLASLGRENRYVADYETETTVTMASEAAKRVLEKSGLSGKDIDMVVFVSGTPEYLWPPNSVAVHRAIDGKADAVVYDMNVNCVGMVVAVDQVSRSMMSNPFIHRALIVGSEQMHQYAREEDAVTYASFGDGASAVILEKDEERAAGFIDSAYKVNTESIDKIMFPPNGMSKTLELENIEKKVKWENVSNDKAFLTTVELIEELLQRNQLTPQDIQTFCFSQLSGKNIQKIQEIFNEDPKKFPIVGTEYGYTGAASPFMAFERALTKGQIKRDDYAVFWSVGAGSVACAMLFKY